MNILWLSWKDPYHPDAGGAEQSGEQHAIAWLHAGHTVKWVSTGFPGSQKKIIRNGIFYERIGQKWMWYFGFIHLLFCFHYLFRFRRQYDLVVDEIHGPPLLTPLYVHKPILVIIHEVAGDIWQKTVPFPISWIGQHFVEPLFFQAYKNVQFVIGAETTSDDVIKLGVPRHNIKFVPYGVTAPLNKPTLPKSSAPTLIFLSSLRPMKGFERVYSAFQELQTKVSELQLWVVGDDSSEYAQQIKHSIDNPAVTFYGRVSQNQKFELLQQAWILVHGSFKEGWGLVVIEANLVGTPAVVYDAAGLRNSIVNQETGFLAKDQTHFVETVLNLIENKNLYQQIQGNAIRWSEKFDWDNATSQSLQLIQSFTPQSESVQ